MGEGEDDRLEIGRSSIADENVLATSGIVGVHGITADAPWRPISRRSSSPSNRRERIRREIHFRDRTRQSRRAISSRRGFGRSRRSGNVGKLKTCRRIDAEGKIKTSRRRQKQREREGRKDAAAAERKR